MKKFLFIFGITLLFSSCKENGLSRDAFVLDVKSVALQKNVVWFGGEQDIIGCPDMIIDAMQDSVLEIRREGNGFVWHLNKPAYVKFNGNNPNAVDYDSVSSISIAGQNISKEEIENTLNAQNRFEDLDNEKFRYTFLSDIIKVTRNNTNDRIDSIRTIFAYNKEKKIFVLLDRDIVVTKNNNSIKRFDNEGNINGNSVKIEFFHSFHSSFLSTKDKKKYFHWNDTCFSASVKSFYTPFGASEITLQANNENNISVSFNKIFRVVIPEKAIYKVYADNDNIPISIRQLIHANTYSNEVYTMNMSNADYLELGTIGLNEDYKFEPSEQNTLLKNGEFESYNITNGIFGTFGKGCLPLVLVFLLGLSLLHLLNYDNIYEGQDNQGEDKRWKFYFLALYSLLFALGIGRIFIGYNLSFTQPFNTNFFPTAVIVAPLILLNVLLFWLVRLRINFGKEVIKRYWFVLFAFLIVPIILYLCYKNNSIFSFYWDNLMFQNYSVEHSASFIHTIYLLTALLIVNIFCLFSGTFLKSKIILFFQSFSLWVIAILFFALGKNSYSSGLFLIGVFVLMGMLFIPKLSHIPLEESFKILLPKLLLYVLFSIVLILFVWLVMGDVGYMINVWLFPIIMAIIITLVYAYNYSQGCGDDDDNKRKANKNAVITLTGGIIALVAVYFVIIRPALKNYAPSSRFESRMTMFYDFDKIHETGYRQSEEHSQFFAILTKYAYPSEYDCYEPIHSGISNYIDPIVENDLSVPFGFIYQFGSWWKWSIALLVLIWGILSFYVLKQAISPVSISNNSNKEKRLTKYAVIRLFCLSMLVGSSVWLILSYYGIVPFTGRLIFGMGQDSIAEVFETLFLFAFMGLIGKT
jgi:hypothetical protein